MDKLVLDDDDKEKDDIEKITLEAISLLPSESRLTLTQLLDKSSVRWRNIEILLIVLKSLKDADLSKNKTFLSANYQRTTDAAVEIIASFGIIPYLLPGVGLRQGSSHLRVEANEPVLTDLQKYDRLSATIRDLMYCFDDTSLRLVLMPQLGPLLAALLQLSYVPLAKPSSAKNSSTEFKMTKDLYEKLTKDQNEFREILSRLIDNCPRAVVAKELMIIHGVKNSPNWIRRKVRMHLENGIVAPNGIEALVDAVCNDTIDLGAHWDKLDVVARLVAASHGQNAEEYFDAVCSQLINLLVSKRMKHSTTIANHCIAALHEHNAEVCREKIVYAIASPLREFPTNSNKEFVPTSETEVDDCIDKLTKCFIPIDGKFKYLPPALMKEFAIPLFHLHAKVRKSVSHLRSKIKDLLIHLLAETTLRDDLFSAFLEHNESSRNFGKKISCRFGPSGGLEIIGKTESLDYETAADSLFDLTSDDPKLGFGLFNYLLRSLATLKKIDRGDDKTNDDTLDRVGKELAAMKLLSNLAGTRAIQRALINDCETFLTFVKSLFDEESSGDDDDGNIQVLYVSLMLIKVILSEEEKPKDWVPFDELAKFLTSSIDQTKVSRQLLDLVRQVVGLVKNRGRSTTRRYDDLSVDGTSTSESELEKALRDLGDPLLPIRAHGLMTLTKLIESRDPEAIGKKDIILCFFRENLKDEDSFVYLAAVNGLCALALVFPQNVVETLVQEYIDMPGRNSYGDITPETRAKLGEILVKTTRALGPMAPAYKNILINGFLCGTRDPDEMVRASSLSCLGELCKVLAFRLGNAITEVLYCVGCIIESDKVPECRRAAVLVATLLIRGLGDDVLTDLGSDLVPLYRALKFLRDNDDDQVLRLHAQLALDELDDTVKTQLLTAPHLNNRIFRLP